MNREEDRLAMKILEVVSGRSVNSALDALSAALVIVAIQSGVKQKDLMDGVLYWHKNLNGSDLSSIATVSKQVDA